MKKILISLIIWLSSLWVVNADYNTTYNNPTWWLIGIQDYPIMNLSWDNMELTLFCNILGWTANSSIEGAFVSWQTAIWWNWFEWTTYTNDFIPYWEIICTFTEEEETESNILLQKMDDIFWGIFDWTWTLLKGNMWKLIIFILTFVILGLIIFYWKKLFKKY